MSGFVVCFPFVLDWVNESVLCDWLVLMPVLTRSQQAREETPERRALREKLDDFFLRGSSRSGEYTEMMDDQPDERHGRRDTSETRTDRDAGRRPILEKFWGDEGEDLEGWLFGIEMVAAAESWGNERTLNSAIIALRGRARTEARMAMADDELETWSDLCDLLRNRFGPVSPVAYWNRKLMTMKQKRDEGVRVFSSRFRNALTQLERVQGAKLLGMTSVSWFLEGLRQDLQAEVERDEPQCLSQAIESAEKGERVVQRARQALSGEERRLVHAVVRDTHGSIQDTSVDQTTALLQQLVVQQGQILEFLMHQASTSAAASRANVMPVQRSRFDPSRGPYRFRGRCFRCDQEGHRVEHCPFPPARPPTPSTSASTMSTAPPAQGRINVIDVDVNHFEPCTSGTAPVIRTNDDGQQTVGPPSKLPRCSLTLDGVSIVDCVIDTGAEVSIVSPPVVERAGAAISVTETAPSLYAANNQPLTCTGTTRLTVSPGGFSHEFAVIEDFAYPVLLGADFLTRVGAVIDLKRGVVSIATDSPNKVVHLPVRRVFSQAESCPGELVNISTQPQPRTLVISRGRDSQDDEEACPDLTLVEEDRHRPSVSDQRLRAQVTINEKLTGKQVEQLNSLLEEFKDVFAENEDDLGHTNVAEHTIDTGSSKPTNRPPYRIFPAERQVIADHAADMKRRGIVDEQRDWDVYLSSLAFAYRSSVVDSIGETPYYLVHSCDPKLPTSVIFGSKAQLRHDAQQCGLDLTQRLRDSFQAALAVQENKDGLRKKRYDQLHVKTDYAEGELVLLFVPQTQPGLARKLQCKWRGLFRIVQKTTSLNYVIRDLDTNKTQKVHVQRLRKYFPLPEHLLPTDDDETSKCTCRCA